MRVTFIGHASILIETRGLRILSDPWWRGPCFGAQWWTYPAPWLEPLREPVDYIYVSHGHHDHLHPGTLKTLDRTAKVLLARGSDLGESIRALGMEVVEVAADAPLRLPEGIDVRIVPTQGGDTLFTLADGERVCVNLNDSLHSTLADVQDRFVGLLKAWHPRIEYLFCGYGTASHFPNCYVIPGKDREATAARRQAHFNRQWSRIVAGVQPRFAFPFAADVVLLEEDLIWVNEPAHNAERPTTVFQASHPGSPTVVLDIAPGFQIDGDTVTRTVLRRPTETVRLREDCADGVRRANAYGTATDETFAEVLELVRRNVQTCEPYLREHRGDYRFLVRFRNHPKGIVVAKAGDVVEVAPHAAASDAGFDVVYRTRLHYLKSSLTTEYGYEILFVGSGGVFEYVDAADARRNLHRELMTMLTPHETSPPSRYGRSSPAMFRFKALVKTLLGRQQQELYDLDTWTVWR